LPTSVVALIVGVSATLGCRTDFCLAGLDLGTTYRVTVLEPADANGQYAIQTSHGPDFGISVDPTLTCGTGFDFVSGSTFLIEPVSKGDINGCWGRIAVPTEVAVIQLVSQTNRPVAGGEVMGTPIFQVDRGAGCTGEWQLDFLSTRHEPPLNTPVPGEYPPVVLERIFTSPPLAEVQSCLLPNSKLADHRYCIDYFVVKLEKT